MSEFVTKKEFEIWKQSFEKRKSVGAILAMLAYNDDDAAYFNRLLIQMGSEAAGTTSVTFDIEYKIHTTPFVFVIAKTNTGAGVIASINTVSKTGFTVDLKYGDLSAANQPFNWIAFGERA